MKEQLKRYAKICISVFYYAGNCALNLLRRLVRVEVPPTCVVLYYHSILPESRKSFSRQLELVRRLTISLDAANRRALLPGKRYSVITIDDGFKSADENGIPELLRLRIPVTVFVSPDLLGTKPKWATFDGDVIEDEQIVSAEQINRWPADLVTVGSHTLTHPWLPASTEEDAIAELSGSRAKLRGILNKEVELFSFPYGGSTERLIELCRQAGYRRVFTNIPNQAFADPEEFVTGRVKVEPTDWPLEFRLKLLGAYRWMPAVSAWKRRFSPWSPNVDASQSTQ